MVTSGCFSSVSVFTVDYDAPLIKATSDVRKSLLPLVGYLNGTGNGTGRLRFFFGLLNYCGGIWYQLLVWFFISSANNGILTI